MIELWIIYRRARTSVQLARERGLPRAKWALYTAFAWLGVEFLVLFAFGFGLGLADFVSSTAIDPESEALGFLVAYVVGLLAANAAALRVHRRITAVAVPEYPPIG